MDRRMWWDELRQDLSYGVRQLARAPWFAAVTVLTLSIAIGVNTAVFSVVNGVLLRPLPYPEAEQLVYLWTRYLPPSGFDIDKFSLSGPELLDLSESTRSLASLGAFQLASRTLTGDGTDAERVSVGLLSRELLPTLGVRPLLGRWFTPEEDTPEAPPAVILSHEVWADRYGEDAGIIGRSILMDGISTEVVGVMPPGFAFPRDTRAWLPLGLDRSVEGGRGAHWLYAVGRLAADAGLFDLESELALTREAWAREYEHNVAHFPWAQDMRTELVADAPARLRLLMAAVALILLVACANVANLLLARAERRQTEVAVRTALGAGRGRITRQLATESLLLAAISAALGVVLAAAGVRALVALDPEAMPRLAEVEIDATVLFFTSGVTVVTALLFGIAPAHIVGRRAAGSVASATSRTAGNARGPDLRRWLVTGEVAVSLVVVILAGLVVRSYASLTGTDPRMNPENLLTFSLSLSSTAYSDEDLVPQEFERLLDRVRAVPGVTSATAATYLPFRGLSQWDFQLDDRPPRQEGDMAWNAGITHVATDYFATMGIPVLEGRGFSAADGSEAALVAVVSEALAERYWPGERVIGKRIGYEMDDGVPWMTIVGVVPDPVTWRLDREPYPHLYVPQAQAGVSTYVVPRSLQLAVRSGIEEDALVPGVRAAITDYDSDLPLYDVTTMEDVVSESLSGPRVTTNLLGIFGAIALALAAVGIYGVISYSVAGRTREIGVRVALGAERGEITRMIVGEGARPVVLGVVVGLAGAWLATRLVEAMLYGVERTDALTFTLLPLALLFVGVIASWVPSIRATRITPTEALRDD